MTLSGNYRAPKYFQHPERIYLITGMGIDLSRLITFVNWIHEKKNKKKNKNFRLKLKLLKKLKLNPTLYDLFMLDLSMRDLTQYLQIKIISNFFFSLRRFSAWQTLKEINNLILEKNIFYKFYNKKNPFNNQYKNKKIRYLNWFWKIRN